MGSTCVPRFSSDSLQKSPLAGIPARTYGSMRRSAPDIYCVSFVAPEQRAESEKERKEGSQGCRRPLFVFSSRHLFCVHAGPNFARGFSPSSWLRAPKEPHSKLYSLTRAVTEALISHAFIDIMENCGLWRVLLTRWWLIRWLDTALSPSGASRASKLWHFY